jgi:hypothetical protein
MTLLFLTELLPLLALGWTGSVGAELGIHRLHVMAIALVVSVFLLGLFAQVYRGTRGGATMLGAFTIILVVTVGTLGYGVGRPEEVVPFFLVTGIALLSHPTGRALLRRGESYSPAMLALVAVAALPLLAFALNQLSLTTSTTDPHAVSGHYVMMVGLVAAALAYGLFAAFGFSGWRFASWLAAVPMAYYGFMAISFPAQSGATGTTWGLAAILWAVAFVVVAEYSRAAPSATFRRDVARPSR